MAVGTRTTLSKIAALLTVFVSGLGSAPLAFGQGRSVPPQRPPVQPQQRPPVRQPQQRPPTQGQPMQRQGVPQQRRGGGRGEEAPNSDRNAERSERSERLGRSERSERSGHTEDANPERVDRAERRRQVRPPDMPARPRALPRLMVYPKFIGYWNTRYRSIYSDIRFVSRRGFIPVTAIPADVCEVTDYSDVPAGWRGYGIVVPPRESVTINLEHPNRGWFRLIICDAWGQAVPGGLSSTLPQFQPKLTYTNPGDAEKAIYLLVDDPGWMSSDDNPYMLQLAKSWNPDLVPVDQGLIVAGVWGMETSVNAKFRRPMVVMPGFK